MRRSLRVLPIAVALTLGAAACASSGSDAKSTPTTQAPEDVLVSNAVAAAGLANLRTIVGKVQSDPAAPNISSVADAAWAQWIKVEGRVKKNDTGAYLDFEDALSDLRTGAQDGVDAKVQKGATALEEQIRTYLDRFPG
jgi:hypothetical protein